MSSSNSNSNSNGNGNANVNVNATVQAGNNVNTPRVLAEDAAAWYFSRLDPYASNESNIQTFLRTPLVALTVKALQKDSKKNENQRGHKQTTAAASTTSATSSKPLSSSKKQAIEHKNSGNTSSSSSSSSSGPGRGVEEHKEARADTDTDDTDEDDTKKQNNDNDWRHYLQSYNVTADQTTQELQRLQDEYEDLTRRTKARMEAFLAGCSLAVPGEVEDTAADSSNNSNTRTNKPGQNNHNNDGSTNAVAVSLQDGLSGFATGNSNSTGGSSNGVGNGSQRNHHNHHSNIRRGPSLTEKVSRTMIGDVANPQTVQHPQIEEKDLVVRLEVYIRTVQRVHNLKEECVVAMEPPKVIRTRARYVTNAFVATTSYVRNINPVLTRLLSCLTMEMLAVECLAEEITKVIHRVVLEYAHGTSFASLAFLSTPEVNADSLLTPLILKYLKYLQADWERLVKECQLERLLARSLDPSMRKMFKTIEFQSIGHLLEVCHEYRYKLNNIELPPNVCAIAENIHSLCNSPEAIRQALRDLRREIITVNGHVLPPVTSRKELIQLLTQTLNSRTLTAKEAAASSGLSSTKKKNSHRRRRKTGEPKKRTEEAENSDTSAAGKPKARAPSDIKNSSDADADVDESLTEYEDFVFSSEYESSSAVDDSAVETLPSGDQKKTSAGASRRRRSRFHLSTIDVLTRRLLIAASRTGNGGDAYFFVKDLFGGEEVDVVPSNTFRYQDRVVRPGTIDILVRLASVTIKCHQSFDIYPKDLVGECEPLIQFHTTTTESISLQEVRAADSGIEEETPLGGYTPDDRTGDNDKENPTASSSVMIVKEQETDRSGWRTISIRAAMYERVETWNTPS
mmetsp:Transcript_29532/g.71334  ORF Transcript_29532/g.71334 Transcript_29532/m.71334 type:complete len:853 (-) Transcript_29532:116-2674(-)